MSLDDYKQGRYDSSNPQSPFFKGVDCADCGNKTFVPDENGHCPDCQRIKCECGEMHPKYNMKRFATALLCPGCFEYENQYSQ